MGDRFQLDGLIYRKTGPMTALSETGSQRMMPRWMELTPLDAKAMPEARKRKATLDAAQVMQAFEAYHSVCTRLVDTCSLHILEQARQDFIHKLHPQTDSVGSESPLAE